MSYVIIIDFPGGSDSKVSVYNAGDPGLGHNYTLYVEFFVMHAAL